MTRVWTPAGGRSRAASAWSLYRVWLPAHASASRCFPCCPGRRVCLPARRVGNQAGGGVWHLRRGTFSDAVCVALSATTTALVLLVPAAYPTSQAQRAGGAVPKQTSALIKFLFDIALKSDFLFWAAPRLAPEAIDEALLGTAPEVVEEASADERMRITETLNHLLPFSARRLGVLNDASITPFLPRYELEGISAPTLVLSTADDGYGTYAGARYSAEHIPNARFIGYPSGGHLLVGHYEEASSAIVSFIEHYGW